MPIVFACAASHAPGMTAWTEAAPKEQSERFLGCYRKLGEMLATSRPHVLVAITVEHWANFFLNHMPAFCIGRADYYDGPVEEWLKIPKARVPGDSQSCTSGRAGGLICEPLKAVWPAYAGIVTRISLVDRASYLLSLVPLCTLESGLHPAPPLTRNSPSPKSSVPQSSSPDP